MVEVLREPVPEKAIIVNGSEVKIALAFGRAEALCAYLGPHGTFSQEAATKLLDNQTQFTLKSKNEFVVEAVGKGDADIGVVAVENSVDNFVDPTLLELFNGPDLKILGEQILPIHQTLMGRPGAEHVIRSHKKALGQTARYIKEHYPDAVLEEDNSTSLSVELAAQNNQMAIGAATASEIYNLPIIATNIEDIEGNATRFFLIGRGETEPTGHDKTAFLFTLNNYPHAFARSFAVFARHNLNLEPQYMYPTGVLGEKVFFMTVNGHEKDTNTQKAFDDFGKIAMGYKILGSYKSMDAPKGTYLPGLKEKGLI